jgi:hypothetical protein
MKHETSPDRSLKKTDSVAMLASLVDSCLDLLSGLVLYVTRRFLDKKEYYNYPQVSFVVVVVVLGLPYWYGKKDPQVSFVVVIGIVVVHCLALALPFNVSPQEVRCTGWCLPNNMGMRYMRLGWGVRGGALLCLQSPSCISS